MDTFDHTTTEHRRATPRATLTSTSLEQERARGDYLEAILNNAADGILTVDKQGKILSMNPAGCALFGYTRKELKGGSVGILMAGKNGEHTHDMYMKGYHKTGESDIVDYGARDVHGQRKDGHVFPIEIKISSFMTAEGEMAFVGLIRDRTSRTKTRQTLVDANANLTRRVEELKKTRDELRAAKLIAEAADKSKSEFLANMSHELRTPLNAVIGFSEVMLTGAFGEMNEKYTDYSTCILDSGRHLLSLINDILDISKVEAGQFELHQSDVTVVEAVAASHRLIKERAHSKNINIELDVPAKITIFADEVKLKQILLNLLTNAVKFTPEGGKITITARDEDEKVCIYVTDNGIGMDKEGIRKALIPFGQVDGAFTRTQEGTGLGVPLTKKLVELHGGELLMTSELGKGTTVEVCLPKELDK